MWFLARNFPAVGLCNTAIMLMASLSAYSIPDFNFLFDHCLVKFRDAGTSLAGKEEYISIREQQNGNIKNKDPKFFNTNLNKLNISDDATGGAYQKGSIDYIIATDVLGHTRTSNPPDLGAYQSAAFPE